MVKSIINTVKNFSTHSSRASVSCSKARNEWLKIYCIFKSVNVISGQTPLFRASASCSKILNGKKYIQYSEKFQGKLCFSGQVQSCLKILNGKNIFNTVKNFRASANFWKIVKSRFNTVTSFSAHSVFRASATCLKNLKVECKINTVKNIRANSVLEDKSTSCSKILNGKKYVQYSENFHGKLSKNPEW